MKKIQEQFKEAMSTVALSKEEKADIRYKLVEYMEYKPIRGATSPVHEKSLKKMISFPFFQSHHLSGALLIAVLIGSSTFGVSFAAGDALPGDFLYNIKVNVNEEIKTALLSSNESRISWERERAERRLVEASQLESEGRLDVEKQQKVSKLFAEHTSAMVEQVRAIEESDPVFAAEMSSVLEDSLDAHEAVLARLIVENENGTDEGARELVAQVRTVAMEVEKMRNDVEEKIALDETEVVEITMDETEVETPTAPVDESKTESANLRVRAAYRAEERATELLTRVRELQATLDPSSELAVQAQAQVAFGEELVLAGKESLAQNNLGDAYGKYRKASASLQKVVQLLEVAKLFSIEIYPDREVSESSEEELEQGAEVPEDAQVLEELQNVRASVQDEIAHARALLLTQEGHNTELVEKANNRIKEALSHLLRGEIAMVLNDYTDARNLFEQAQKLISETLHELELAGEEDEVNDVPVPSVTPEEVVPIDEPKDVEDDTYLLNHQYKDGVHSFTGSVTLPTPCHTLEQSVAVAESAPEQLRIELTVKDPEPGMMCIQVLQDVEFTVEAKADEEAVLTQLRVNGVEQKWEIRKTDNSSGEELQ